MYGSIIVIKRSGEDGSVFPLLETSYLLGRGSHCDIRVQLPDVAEEHCRIKIKDNQQARSIN